MIRITSIDHRVLSIARQIHAIHMVAYRQEAALLGATRFPPLECTVTDIWHSTESFIGAFIEDELVGALSTWPDRKDGGTNIASLVVRPDHQRRGVGRALLRQTVVQLTNADLTVQTAARNVPAIALYHQFGFVEFRRWLAGREQLELVKLRRPAAPIVAASPATSA
jgi:ribosomal protein S18 acetylase RimI-like enzyme